MAIQKKRIKDKAPPKKEQYIMQDKRPDKTHKKKPNRRYKSQDDYEKIKKTRYNSKKDLAVQGVVQALRQHLASRDAALGTD